MTGQHLLFRRLVSQPGTPEKEFLKVRGYAARATQIFDLIVRRLRLDESAMGEIAAVFESALVNMEPEFLKEIDLVVQMIEASLQLRPTKSPQDRIANVRLCSV